jgi:serine/threonine protein kinase/Flp pilus assembly protein TadD
MIGETFSHYRVIGKLGQGGMGVVYRATDLELGRTVALKFIPDEAVDNPGARERLLREARAASQLDHVNIGTIFGVEQTAEGRLFIVMAYYEGETLAAVIRRGALAPPVARDYCIQMARGLAEAHAHGVIHRDVKPSNVLVARGRVLKLVDFGLARLEEFSRITRTGARLGTPSYMSPEQAQGLAVDHRGDLWAVGVILYEMLTGRVPFEADSAPATLYKIVHTSPPSLAALDPELRRVVGKAMAKEPNERYQSAVAMLTDLGDASAATDGFEAVSSREETAVLPTTSGSLSRWRRVARRRWAWGAAAGAGALGLLLFVVPGSPLHLRALLSSEGSSRAPAASRSAPVAYEKYMKGMSALDRWDKGDNLATAVGLFEESVRLDPHFALAFAQLSEAHRLQSILGRDQKLADRALEEATRATELNPELAPVQVALGRAHARKGETDLALECLQRALKLDAFNVDALIALSGVYAKLGRPKDAEASLQRAVAVRPDSWAAHNSFGNFLFRHGRYDEAIEHWRRVLEITPDNASAYTNLGAAFAESGRLAEAQTMYERALAIKPNATLYMNLGTVLFSAGRYAEAARRYQQALKLDDRDYLIWGNLAAAYSWIPGEKEKAAPTFEKAVSLAEVVASRSPTDPYVNADLGLYYAKLNRAEDSIRHLRTALSVAPEDPEIQAWAAEGYEVLGERKEALEHAGRALELGYPPEKFERNPQLDALRADPRFPRSPGKGGPISLGGPPPVHSEPRKEKKDA